MDLKNGNRMVCDRTGRSCPVLSRPSFREAIARAEDQIELGAIDHFQNEARELCMIMAEVWMMNPADKLRISGEMLDVYLVQEVLREVSCEHVRLVLSNFHNVTYLVQNKKAYLRAALYNSVFEMEAHYANRVARDLKGENA